MTAKKQKLEKSGGPRKGSIASVVARLRDDYGLSASTGAEYSKTWRYLEFRDPKTGLPSIAHEYITGASGFRAGTINQLRGLAGTGKSSLIMLEYASAVRNGGAYCAHLETEGAGMKDSRIAEFGLDPSNLVIPDEASSFEKVVEFIDTFRCAIRGGLGGSVNDLGRKSATKFRREDADDPDCEHPILIGIDSLSNLGREDDTLMDISDMSKARQPGWLPRQIKAWLRDKAKQYEKDLLTMFLTSQEIVKIATGASSFLPPEKDSVAGSAIKFFDTIAIDLSISDWKDKAGQPIGREMKLRTFKNKLSSGTGRRVSFFLTAHDGFDLIHTDAEFLLGKSSPFADGAGFFEGSGLCKRDAWGITCKPLGDRRFKTEDEFVRAFYDNKEVLDTVRDGLRIVGYGLPHESKYKDCYDENGFWIGDGKAAQAESTDSEGASGVPEEPALDTGGAMP